MKEQEKWNNEMVDKGLDFYFNIPGIAIYTRVPDIEFYLI
jgi:hypothetical protein